MVNNLLLVPFVERQKHRSFRSNGRVDGMALHLARALLRHCLDQGLLRHVAALGKPVREYEANGGSVTTSTRSDALSAPVDGGLYGFRAQHIATS